MLNRPYLSEVAESRLFDRISNWLLVQQPGEDILRYFIKLYEDTFQYHILLDTRQNQKSWGRCVQKVLQYVEDGKASDEIEAIDKCLKDTAGARVIVLFPSDRELAVNRFKAYVDKHGTTSSNRLPCFSLDGPEEVKEYKTGYRAIHQDVWLKMDNGEWAFFEVQFMNVLQHMWDKIQGPLYRDQYRYPKRLHNKVAHLSKTCDEICGKASNIITEISSYHRRIR